jgi:hypothetical protein
MKPLKKILCLSGILAVVPLSTCSSEQQPSAAPENSAYTFSAASLVWVETLDFLPQQHVLIFKRS